MAYLKSKNLTKISIFIILFFLVSIFVTVNNVKLLYADGAGSSGGDDCSDGTTYIQGPSPNPNFGGYEISKVVSKNNNKIYEISKINYPKKILDSSKKSMMIYYYVFDPFGLELGNGTTKIESKKWVYDKIYLPDVIYNHYKAFAADNPKPFNIQSRPYCMVGGLYRTYYHKVCTSNAPKRDNRYLTFYCHTTQDLFDSILIPSNWNKNLLVYCNYGSDVYVENELPDLYIGGRNLNVYRGCVVKNLNKRENNTVLVTGDIGNLKLDNKSKYVLSFSIDNNKDNNKLNAHPVRILQAFMDKNKNGIKEYKLINNVGTIHYNLKESFVGPLKQFLDTYYTLIKTDSKCKENTEVCTYYYEHTSDFLPSPSYFKLKSKFKDTKIKFLGVSKTTTRVVYDSSENCYSCGEGETACETDYYYFNLPNTFYFLIENTTVTVSKITNNPIKYLEVTKNVTIGNNDKSEIRDYFVRYIPPKYSGMGVTYITDFDFSKFNTQYIANLVNPPDYFEDSRVLLFYYIGPGKGVYGYEIPAYKYYLNNQNVLNPPSSSKVDEYPIYFIKFKGLGFTQQGCVKSLAYYQPNNVNSPVNIYNSKITCLPNGVVINSLKFANPKEAYLLFLNLILGINS